MYFFLLWIMILVSCLTILCLTQGHEVSFVISFRNFIVLPLRFRSIILMYGWFLLRRFLHMYIQLSQHHLLKWQSFMYLIILAALSKIKGTKFQELIYGLSILLHWSIFLPLSQCHVVLITLTKNFEIGKL